MAWSDAARRVSALVRKMRSGRLYHGGPVNVKGGVIRAESRAYATEEMKIASGYASRQRHGGAIYEVQRPYIPKDVTRYRATKQMTFGSGRLRSSFMPKRVKLFGNPGVESSQSLRILRKLPRLKGRASRGY